MTAQLTAQDYFNAGLQMILVCWTVGIGFGLAAALFKKVF